MNFIFLLILTILLISVGLLLCQFYKEQKKNPGCYNNAIYLITAIIIFLFIFVPISLLYGMVILIIYWSEIKSVNIPQITWYFILLMILVSLRFILKQIDSIICEYFSVDRIINIINFFVVLAISINSMSGNINTVDIIENNTFYAVCITYIALSEAFFSYNNSE